MKNKEIGLSRYVLAVLGLFLVGIFFADLINFHLDVGWLMGIFIGLISILVLYYKDQYYRITVVGLLGLIIGMSYIQFWAYKENRKIIDYGLPTTVYGTIIEKPEISNDQRIIIAYNNTKILVQTAKYPQYSYGDILAINGKIEDPSKISVSPNSNFHYGQYLLKKGIRGLIKNPESVKVIGKDNSTKTKIYRSIFFVGDKFEQSLNRTLAEPYAAFQDGLLLGNKSNLPDSLISAFNRTGTTHIIAVSGFNVTIIISALSLILMAYSRRWAFWGSIMAILVFIILTGASASVVRAGVLAALVSYCKILGRRPYYPILILWVAVLMLLFNPYALTNDVSFQLSFLAFAGLVFISPKIETIKLFQLIPRIIRVVLGETLGAQILVLPILVYNFGIISLVAPIVNILILPLVPYAMFAGFSAGLGGMIWFDLGRILGVGAYILLKYILTIVETFSRFSWAAISYQNTTFWWLPIYYYIIYLLVTKTKGKQVDQEVW